MGNFVTYVITLVLINNVVFLILQLMIDAFCFLFLLLTEDLIVPSPCQKVLRQLLRML